ncbi:MAG TPA: sigma 54-interacting transcriptional regulator, partial [Polyangiaceae bacterium]|nr:sigma 54-interacting transcriptional regulator [Polyangiaceae bacterium]
VVQRDGTQVVEVPDSGEATIGRAEGSTLHLDDSRVSRSHARVAWEGGELLVEDLGSRNPTLLNGQPLAKKKQSIRGGDSLRIAGYEIRVALSASAPASDDGTTPAESDGDSDGVVVADESMARVFGFARRVARASATVLILGETGVGKEVVAGRIHAWSQRCDRRFVRVNCAALPESLVESELFGHERGAFTGAERRKVGFAEAAHEGTLFLDEIGELQLPVQAKLLSMLENRSVVRVGNTVETPVDVRVIAATHRSLTREIEAGRFREDLYYRIGVVVIRVPPLRERPSEISLLAQLFAKRYGQAAGFGDATIAADASAALLKHSWPGNVRELRNAIEHALLLSEDGIVRRIHLPETVLLAPPAPSSPLGSVPPQLGAERSASQFPPPPPSSPQSAGPSGVRAAMAEVERSAIAEALRVANNNRTQAALALGISLRSLLYKIDKYGLKQG